MPLTAEAVHKIFLDCLFKDEEIVDGKPPENFVEVTGVILHIGFHPGRLESHKEEIFDLLMELPEQFKMSSGGGWSFLNACMDKNDHQWGEHRTIDELICLGLAIKKVEFQMPRSMWSILPGGMPYFCVLDVEISKSDSLQT